MKSRKSGICCGNGILCRRFAHELFTVLTPVVVLILLSVGVGCRPEEGTTPELVVKKDPIVGVYLEKSSPTPKIPFRLEILPDNRWVLANQMTGLWGTWAKESTGYSFRTLIGPSGKIDNPEKTSVDISGSLLKMGMPGREVTFVRLTGESFVLPLEELGEDAMK